MKKTILLSFILSSVGALAQDKVDFAKDIQPLLERSCVKCHNSTKAKGKLNLEVKDKAMAGGEDGKGLVAGKPDDSHVLKAATLPEDDEDAMPPKGKGQRLSADEAAKLKKWIEEGANWPDGVKLKVPESKDDKGKGDKK